MNQLIPLHSQTINGNAIETVNARELHEFLGVGRDFSTWIKSRLDILGAPQFCSPVLGSKEVAQIEWNTLSLSPLLNI